DALGGEPHRLEAVVDRVLASRDLELLLQLHQIRASRPRKPKRTETTQRWKIDLEVVGNALPLPAKIEFSRRETDEPYVLEPIRSEVARGYAVPPPTANHYTASAATRQKIRALAKRR